MTASAEVIRSGTEKQSALSKYSEEQINHLRKHVTSGDFDDSELAFFLAVCEQKGLDPFKKQIYGVKRWLGAYVNGEWQDKVSSKIDVMTGIDGYRAIANRCGDYAPGEEFLEYDKDGRVASATVTVQKLVKGTWKTFPATAYFEEYAPYYYDKKTRTKKLGDMWTKMPRRMITKCAEALALRKGWPEELGDINVTEEMERAYDDERDNPLFSQLAKEQPAQQQAALPPAQVVATVPPTAVAKQQAEAPKQAQAANADHQRPATKPGEGLPELWAVNDPIPAAVLLWLKPIADLAGTPVHKMETVDLERVVEVVRRGREMAEAKPNRSQRLLDLLEEIATAAQYTLDKKLGAVPPEEDGPPPLDDSHMPVGG